MSAEVNEVTQPPVEGLELAVEIDSDNSETRRPRVIVTLHNNGSESIEVGVGRPGVFAAGLAEGANAILLETGDDSGYRLDELPAIDSVVRTTIDAGESVSTTFDMWNIPEALEDRPPYGTHTFVSSYKVEEEDIEDEEEIVEGSFTVTVE